MNKVEIADNMIYLRWDGTMPPSAPSGAVHCNDDVVYFWPHLKGFARWYKRANAFGLDFSKQNIKRLHAQFGQIPVITGREQLTDLKQKNSALVDMIRKIEKAKTLPIEQLPKYSYKVSPLGEFQHRGVVFLRNAPLAPLFADCGMGKTFCVLVSTELQLQYGEIPPGKTLICVKLATIDTGWLEDAQNFTNLRLMSLWLPQSKNRKEKILERLHTPADVYVINHDGLRVFENELAEVGFKKVVVDESTILKNFRGENARGDGGQFGKALMHVASQATHRVIMSGTPAPNGPKDLWGQFYFLDPKGLLLEGSHRDFMERFYQTVDLRRKEARFTKDGRPRPLGPRDPRKLVPKTGAIEEVSNLITPMSYRVRIRDHIKELPEETSVIRTLEMSEEQAKHYEDMDKRLRVVIDDTRITVPVKIAQMMKLRQITGGFIIDHEEKPHPIKDNPKLEELDSLVEDEIAHDEKIIIYAQYQWEIKTIEERYKHHKIVSAYGGNSSVKNLKNIEAFIKDPKVRIVVMHPRSMAHGLNLTMSHYIIFYSISHSAEENYQCIGRIKRANQKHPMFIYFLLCQKSVDQMIHKVINLKNMNQAELIDTDRGCTQLLNLWRNNG